MAATVFPEGTQTAFTALAGTSATTVLTVDTAWKGAYLFGVMVTDSTGSVATAAQVDVYRGSTAWVLVPVGVGYPDADWNLEWVAHWPIRLNRGDLVRVTGASGHHVFVSYAQIGTDTGVSAQQSASASAPR